MRYQLITIAVGLWLAAAPAALDVGGPAAALHQIVGPLVAANALVACSDLGRPLRWLNVALAVLFAATALVPPFLTMSAAADALIATLVIVALAVRTPAGPRRPYGGGWRAIVKG